MKIYAGPVVGRYYEPGFLRCVWKLIERYPIVWRPQENDALVSRARSISASRFLRERVDCDVHLSVDTDILFSPDDAVRACQLALEHTAVVVAIYPCRDASLKPASIIYPGQSIDSRESDLQEIRYGATGFMAVPRAIFERLSQDIPLCHERDKWPFYPFYMPFISTDDTGQTVYLSEDYAFCERARMAGFPILVAPDIKLGHIGQKVYAFGGELNDDYRLSRLEVEGYRYALEWGLGDETPAESDSEGK